MFRFQAVPRVRHAIAASAALWAIILPTSGAAGATPEQPRAEQWALDGQHLNAVRVWTLSTGRNVIVGVIDSGVDAHSPDLAGHVQAGADFTGRAADGRLDDSTNGHGTAVASIITGTSQGPNGVAGLAPDATILPVRVSDDLASNPAALAQGIEYAALHGASVINISTGATLLNPQVRAAVDEAVQRDIVVVAAAGNNGLAGNPAQYPAALPGVVAVAASDINNKRWPKSESGSYIGLTAPGVDIYAAAPQGTHQKTSGTSFAAPYVAATAALLRARYPHESATQIINRMTSTATSPTHGRDIQWGFGIINPYAALTAPPPAADAPNSLTLPAQAKQPDQQNAHPHTAKTIVAVIAGIAAILAAGIILRKKAIHPPRPAARRNHRQPG
jgi:type VII secretion-associated serine protease mycosin